MEGKHLSDGGLRVKFLRLRSADRGTFCTLSHFDMMWNRITVPETGGYVSHGQRVYAAHECGAERNIMKPFVLIRDENDEHEEIWVG